jgi:hypothetical protein
MKRTIALLALVAALAFGATAAADSSCDPSWGSCPALDSPAVAWGQ